MMTTSMWLIHGVPHSGACQSRRMKSGSILRNRKRRSRKAWWRVCGKVVLVAAGIDGPGRS